MSIPHHGRAMLAGAALCLAVPGAARQAAPSPKAPPSFQLLRAEDFAADVVLPPPPAPGSEQERLELAELHRLIADASPARVAQAKADDADETPGIFDGAIGARLEDMPATWALLRTVQNEGDRAAEIAKVRFARARPWGVDPTMPRCDGSGGKPTRSYPSGHATLGYSVGLMLATLTPAKATAVMARAADYATSREICGVHFPSDVEASHALGSMVATRILLDPAAAPRLAAARAELARLP